MLDIFFLLVLLLSGFSLWIRETAAQCSPYFLFMNGLYVLMFSAGVYCIHFPLRFFEEFVWEHKFQLSNQTFMQWFFDDAKKALINGMIILIAVEAIYLFLRQLPDIWWIVAGIFWLFLTLVLARLTPNILIPFFFKYSPIENQELRSRILGLFRNARIKIKDAYLINFSAKTKKANAFICGLGQSRRVVLSDTLVAEFSISEIETVVAHEIGHYKHHDVLRLTVVNALVVFLGFFIVHKFLIKALAWFGLMRLDDIAFFPMVMLAFTVLGFLMMPLLNGYSRALEIEADLFSLRLTRKPYDFVSMMRKLGEMNLADFEPSKFTELFFYSHPPILKRIKCAEGFGAG